ncbi:hypothetical protein L596_001007 [Steinernema carpocapsae]|uniref:Uncharacterized protein n=1 Tax=Steinernema carpocapsae TaxID=34508 RepID=A0A4U8UMB5_STECR|nr:hypothetical protein L596_001007 [Steinernema carpocapsae]
MNVANMNFKPILRCKFLTKSKERNLGLPRPAEAAAEVPGAGSRYVQLKSPLSNGGGPARRPQGDSAPLVGPFLEILRSCACPAVLLVTHFDCGGRSHRVLNREASASVRLMGAWKRISSSGICVHRRLLERLVFVLAFC